MKLSREALVYSVRDFINELVEADFQVKAGKEKVSYECGLSLDKRYYYLDITLDGECLPYRTPELSQITSEEIKFLEKVIEAL